MRLNKVIIRNFKRFEEVEFTLPSEHVVIAGPNNTGKTTLLQAIITWQLALRQWLELGDMKPHGGAYSKAPVARQDLFSVPLNNASMLWHGASPTAGSRIQIELRWDNHFCKMEVLYDSTVQVYVRPVYEQEMDILHPDLLQEDRGLHRQGSRAWLDKEFPELVYIPAMTGMAMSEPVYQPAKIQELLGQGRPGDVLRNLLVDVHRNEKQWGLLCSKIKELFGYTLLPPASTGANIRAEYGDGDGDLVKLDIASAGSGFLQVLMLFAFLASRENAVLLLDEPDAHLHILLQDRIFSALKSFAAESKSTLIMATHSERIINAVEPHHIQVLLNEPRPIANSKERGATIAALTHIENTDIMLAQMRPGILYVEGHTDIAILREWARVLEHRLLPFLERPFWKPTVFSALDNIPGSESIDSIRHFDCLKFVNDEMPGIELKDSDGHEKNVALQEHENGLRYFHWRRYEIESYLLHPQRLAAFAVTKTGQQEAGKSVLAYLQNQMPPVVFGNPMEDHDYFKSNKAKKIILNALDAAGAQDFSDMSQIAAAMRPDEIHPEVVEKLDIIADHFGDDFD